VDEVCIVIPDSSSDEEEARSPKKKRTNEGIANHGPATPVAGVFSLHVSFYVS